MGEILVKRVLMVAYHFPPVSGSSGVHRILKFAQYLPEFGWEPSILTVSPRAYPAADPGQMNEVPGSLRVYRAFGLDTARHLSVFGRYPRAIALPDRWISWWFAAVLRGLSVIRREKPRAIWSTYPIATAHLIGLALHRITGLPWIADFRDPMHDSTHPYTEVTIAVNRWIEARVVAACTRAVVTAPGTRRLFEERYPDVPPSRFPLIANGFDEDDFAGMESFRPPARKGSGPVVLVHSGTLYPIERDPRPFFAAVAELLRSNRIAAGQLRIVLRATGHDRQMQAMIDRCGIGSVVELAPLVGHRQALEEIQSADGLLVFQAAGCSHQIPAKVFEYMRSGRPILALTDLTGDTAAVVRAAGMDTVVPIDSKDAIADGLARFLDLVRAGRAPVAAPEYVAGCSRRARTGELAALLEEVRVGAAGAPAPGFRSA